KLSPGISGPGAWSEMKYETVLLLRFAALNAAGTGIKGALRPLKKTQCAYPDATDDAAARLATSIRIRPWVRHWMVRMLYFPSSWRMRARISLHGISTGSPEVS